ncbi:hypothetical protein [Chitinophaga sp. RAB17]|uniref:hypothetical protein n=1 Tax=Chitinophaga sp. RAB17 TaxID=3233049 RepID=UPI003F91AF6F
MKIVKVTYTVKSSFAQQNKENVRVAINELRKLNIPAIKYFVNLGADGKTFTHFAIYENNEVQDLLLNAPFFKTFQQQRDASGLEVAPVIEEMSLVTSSFDMFL